MSATFWDAARRRRRANGVLAVPLLMACVLSQHAAAQTAASADEWPGKQTIKIIVPFSAGSNADLMGRTIAAYLSEQLKATIVVENRVGTGGILGTRAVSKSAPDGYTLCVCSGGAITVPSVVDKGYDPQVDLVPISRINSQPLVLVVNPKSEMKTVADVVALSKTKAGGLNYGSSGVGGLLYNSAEVFRSKTGAQLTHIPFRGGPEAMTALIAGEVDLVFAIMSDVLGNSRPRRSGRLRSRPRRAIRPCRTCRPWSSRACRATTSRSGTACSFPAARPPRSSRSYRT